MKKVIDFYNLSDEASRFSWNSRKIEFSIMTNVLDPMIQPDSYILDVGAGTGAYSFYYVEKGHDVAVVDITPKHIEFINNKRDGCNADLKLEAYLGNAIDLSR